MAFEELSALIDAKRIENVKQEELNYNLVENQIKEYLKQFQGSYLNEKMDEIPIIENIAMKFNNLGADIKLIDDNSMQGENNA